MLEKEAGGKSVAFSSPSVTPLKGAFLQRVEIGNKENQHKAEHGPEKDQNAGFDLLAEDDRPRIKENDLDIEKDEKHCHEIKLHAETGLTITHGLHAALVS